MNRENDSVVILGGLRIDFPYVPYDCQTNFMNEVVSALNTVNRTSDYYHLV